MIWVLPGCFYAKIKLTGEEERLQRDFHSLKTVILYSDSGHTDTVDYISRGAYKTGFVSHFDVLIDHFPSWPKFKNRPKRTFFRSLQLVSRSSYGKRSLLDLYTGIQLYKHSSHGNMLLSVSIFEEELPLNKLEGDTVVFTNSKFKTCASRKCHSKIVWSTKTGIVEIEQVDGTVWKPGKVR